MRLCLFTPMFLPRVGGAEFMADRLLGGMASRGHEVVALAQRQRGGGPMPRVPYPVVWYRRPPRQHWWPEALGAALWRAHRRFKFDLVLAFNAYPAGYAAGLFKKTLGYKLVVNPHGGDLYRHFHALRKARVASTIRRGYRSADRIVSISGWITERLREVCGEGLGPIEQVPNGIDLERWDAELAGGREHVPSDPALSELAGRPLLLHLAGLGDAKQHETALRGLAVMKGSLEGRGVRYAVVGEGNRRAALEALCDELGLRGVVRFLGERTGREKMWLFAHAQMLVTSSREEGMPIVLIEALASGLPVLASDIGPHREVIEGRGCGELFGVGDAQDFAQVLGRMLGADLGPCREAARRWRGEYDIERVIDRYEAACLRTLGTPGRAGARTI